MIDSNVTLLKWLAQSEALTALVGDRIYCPMLPEGYDPASDGPALTFNVRGGSSEAYCPIIRPSVQIEAWAPKGDWITARSVYRALWDHCHGKENINLGADGYILSALEEVQGQDVTDPVTGWASVVTYYSLIMRATA